ncbi:hypothetical protein A2U01_0117947, partial [Trifolium medium]|nr:hypothetical protein [Trifolium medium]
MHGLGGRAGHYPEMSSETRAEMASWAIRSLPPVKSYEGQDTVH